MFGGWEQGVKVETWYKKKKKIGIARRHMLYKEQMKHISDTSFFV